MWCKLVSCLQVCSDGEVKELKSVVMKSPLSRRPHIHGKQADADDAACADQGGKAVQHSKPQQRWVNTAATEVDDSIIRSERDVAMTKAGGMVKVKTSASACIIGTGGDWHKDQPEAWAVDEARRKMIEVLRWSLNWVILAKWIHINQKAWWINWRTTPSVPTN